MLFTHRFGSVETLSRARFWLNWHGITVARSASDVQTETPRLTMNLDLSRASSAFALIDSIERNDPGGWPSLMTQATELHPQPAITRPTGEESLPERAPIHWFSLESSSPLDPTCRKVTEYMLSRWE